MFQILLTRSHFEALVLAATDIAANGRPWGPVVTETGWATRFDGGGNVRTPSDFVSLYGEASRWGKKEGHEPCLYALVECDAWSHDRDRACRYFLRHKTFAQSDLVLDNDGLDHVESAATRGGEWEVVAETDVPEHARKVMEKSIATVRELFGQGGDFFEV
ncbi:MAG: hypothetical protein WCV86_02660 [Patescibacteria group bacterium]